MINDYFNPKPNDDAWGIIYKYINPADIRDIHYDDGDKSLYVYTTGQTYFPINLILNADDIFEKYKDKIMEWKSKYKLNIGRFVRRLNDENKLYYLLSEDV